MAGDGKERPANVAANGAVEIMASVIELRRLPSIQHSSMARALITEIHDDARRIYDANAEVNASTGRRERKPKPANTGRKRKR